MNVLRHTFTNKLDYYKVLQLPRSATTHEIKAQYRRHALATHPDRHNNCRIKTDEFKQLTEAYQVLTDFTKRSEYDRWLLKMMRMRKNTAGSIDNANTRNNVGQNVFYTKGYSHQRQQTTVGRKKTTSTMYKEKKHSFVAEEEFGSDFYF
eukprot:g5672.t1 g5672   contig2:1034605-1035054(-)